MSSQSKYYAIRLQFRGPVHFGSERLDYGQSERVLHSDTLYSAIFQSWAILGKQELIGKNVDNKNFTISSTFPFYHSGEKINYFLPRPYARIFPENANESGAIDRKKLKKITWLDLDHFNEWSKNGEIELVESRIKKGFYTKSPWLPNSNSELDELISSEVYPRVQVSRVEGEDARPYYIEKLYFHSQAGLYFLFYGTEESLNDLKVAMEVLKDEGLGTDRKVGHGQFNYFIESDIEVPSHQSSHSICISLFVPNDLEWLSHHMADSTSGGYELINRGGWITTHPYNTFQKNRLTFFKEGSLFKSSSLISGTVHDLSPNGIESSRKPPHPIYRVGRSIFLPINI